MLTSNNIWLGTQESLDAVMRLNTFMLNPTKEALSVFGWDEDDEEEDQQEELYSGIGGRLIQVEDNVGIIHIKGSLVADYRWYNAWFGVVSYDEIRDAAIKLASEESIDSILLEINTGGGAVHGLSDVADLLSSIDANIKPVEAHTSSYVFSAGMWLASSARKITANRMSEQGSVGVIITMASLSEMYKKQGIDVKVVRAGKYKALANGMEPLSEQAIKEAEAKAEQIYGFFLDAVVRGRPGLSLANKDAWAEGKTFFSAESLSLGLIDEIQTFDKVVANLSSNYDNSNDQAQFSAAENTNTTLDNGEDMGNGKPTKKTVLSEEQLAAAALGAKVTAEEVESEEVESEEETENTEGETENTEENTDGETETSVDPKTPKAEAGEMGQLFAKLETMTSDKAKLEMKLEAKDTELESLRSELKALKPIVAASVERLQIALGQTPTDASELSAGGLANLYAKCDTKFKETFSVGGPKSQANAEDRSDADNVGGFCTIHKPN